MKNYILVIILTLSVIQINAQVKSSHDGFYAGDSVFYQLSGADSFKYCVNCYSADSLHSYHGGVWLHSREHVPNTWENSQWSKETEYDTISCVRQDVVKANTIWVRIYSDTGYTDQHHLVFLGNWRPKTALLISVFLDSSDFMGPHGFYGPGDGKRTKFGRIWNYNLEIEKNCSYQIFGGANLQLEAEQTAGVEISTLSKGGYPNKSMEINVNKNEYNKNVLSINNNVLSLGKSITDSLGPDIKILRLRVGGPDYASTILANAIGSDIIRQDMGGEPSTPICLFVNGSFWTYAITYERMGRNRISKVLKITGKELVSAAVAPVHAINYPKLVQPDVKVISQGNSVYSACQDSNCQLFYFYDDTMRFQIDTSAGGYNPQALLAFCNVVKNGSDSLLGSIIDRGAFFRYALSLWFFRISDGWGNQERVSAAKIGTSPWVLFGEHYDFQPGLGMSNDWDQYFINYPAESDGTSRKTLPWRATSRMIQYDPGYFCLVVEDELNTTYKTEKTVPIAQKRITSFRPCINECSRAWAPTGWFDSLRGESFESNLIEFLRERPTAIANALPKDFMKGTDTLLTIGEMNEVNIRFDSVPGSSVTVILNSLEIKSNFSGKYYPKPDLRIALKYDSTKYEFLKWLEYPKSPAILKLSASKPITLTPVLKLKKK